MAHTLIEIVPLLACPLGMALMAGVPALVHRRKRRRQTAEPGAVRHGGNGGQPVRQAA